MKKEANPITKGYLEARRRHNEQMAERMREKIRGGEYTASHLRLLDRMDAGKSLFYL